MVAAMVLGAPVAAQDAPTVVPGKSKVLKRAALVYGTLDAAHIRSNWEYDFEKQIFATEVDISCTPFDAVAFEKVYKEAAEQGTLISPNIEDCPEWTRVTDTVIVSYREQIGAREVFRMPSQISSLFEEMSEAFTTRQQHYTSARVELLQRRTEILWEVRRLKAGKVDGWTSSRIAAAENNLAGVTERLERLEKRINDLADAYINALSGADTYYVRYGGAVFRDCESGLVRIVGTQLVEGDVDDLAASIRSGDLDFSDDEAFSAAMHRRLYVDLSDTTTIEKESCPEALDELSDVMPRPPEARILSNPFSRLSGANSIFR
ncbi:MAG: hypothetical protein AAFP28_07710 [Pseudomonadota bacterium]